MTSTYVVTSYSMRGSPAYEARKTTIEAASADEAVDAVLRAGRYASKTKRWQHHSDATVRDNAHFQCDVNGFCGASAVRVEIALRPISDIDAEQQAVIDAAAKTYKDQPAI